MKFSAQFFDRQSFVAKPAPRVRLDVTRFGTTAMWGPEKAKARVSGRREELWRFVDMLRDGVEIFDEHGTCVWWGYLSGVTIDIAGWKVGFSLDKTANAIQVAYTTPGGASVKKITAKNIEEDSINLYGEMQTIYSASDITDAQAGRLSEILWDRITYPVASVAVGSVAHPRPLPEGGEITGELVFNGWHTCLDWRYAQVAETGDVDTATQAATLINLYGRYTVRVKLAATLTLPFPILDPKTVTITNVYGTDAFPAAGTLVIGSAVVSYTSKTRNTFEGCAVVSGSGTFAAGTMVYGTQMLLRDARVESASGLVVSNYTRGDASALREIEDLLGSGTINKRRLLCSVERDRSVRVYEEPAATLVDAVLRLDGRVERIGTRWINPYAPSGVWASMRELFGGLISFNSIRGVEAVFIEKCEWDAVNGGASLTLRDNDNPLDVSTVVQG